VIESIVVIFNQPSTTNMAKIFRKARQSLISKGNTGKYIKYALGEIFLVVIGILIALQINTWNESYKKVKKETLYLTRLTTNLGYDLRLYDQIIQKNDSLLDVLTIFENDLLSSPNIKNPADKLSFLTEGYKFSPNRTTIDNLLSSGQIEILRSNYLVEDIFLYYREVEDQKNGVDQALLQLNREKGIEFILNYQTIDQASQYKERLKNFIKLKTDYLLAQNRNYQRQKGFVSQLIDRINKEIAFVKD
jgi:hypothetical protein